MDVTYSARTTPHHTHARWHDRINTLNIRKKTNNNKNRYENIKKKKYDEIYQNIDVFSFQLKICFFLLKFVLNLKAKKLY